MKRYIHKTPRLIKWIYPNWVWGFAPTGKQVAITFDDGPHPEATPFVLNELAKYNAKATFFCVGKNVDKYPELAESIISDGHQLANHTYHHANGRNTSVTDYSEEVLRCEEALNQINSYGSCKLFRPPYGRLKYDQAKKVGDNYKIIMWDVLSGDFDPQLNATDCLQAVVQHMKSGSIVLFHDSKKALNKLEDVLPAYLEILYGKGYKSVAINNHLLE